MSQHTPGPWEQENGGPSIVSRAPNARFYDVALVHHFMDESGETEANASLIAAAPELLEALKTCGQCPRCKGNGSYDKACSLCGDSTYDHLCDDHTVDCADCAGTGLQHIARLAIAKAEGVTP